LQIDHIIPHSTFKYISMDDDSFTRCWALENLRPLSSKQNNLKGNKYD
jgi:5-methylcytosine-specific restriction endonuclease McrA